MRAFLWVGALAVAACGEVVKPETPQPDAAADATPIMADAMIDSPTQAAPMITGVSTPNGGIEVESAGTVTATISGPPNTQVTVAFAGTLGTYTPTMRMLTTDANGAGTASSTFTAGTNAGTEAGTATITAPSGGTPFNVGFAVTPYARYGNPTQFGGGGTGFSQDYLLGQSLSVATGGKLKKIGIIAGMAGNVKIGIYTNNGSNLPGNLVAQIPGTALVVGVNEIALASPVTLGAGTYWFEAVFQTSGGGPYFDAAGNRTIAYISQPYANALPAVFPAPPTLTTYTGNNFNYYVVFGK